MVHFFDHKKTPTHTRLQNNTRHMYYNKRVVLVCCVYSYIIIANNEWRNTNDEKYKFRGASMIMVKVRCRRYILGILCIRSAINSMLSISFVIKTCTGVQTYITIEIIYRTRGSWRDDQLAWWTHDIITLVIMLSLSGNINFVKLEFYTCYVLIKSKPIFYPPNIYEYGAYRV